ncbi:MAG: hypothetical protein KGP27_04770 [Hyphomicrobiales bacterium]|nr:hypothetical protein [Hyphomicrobiales bacterium]
MPPAPPEQALHDALRRAFERHRRVCTARLEPSGDVVVMFYEHLRGLWRVEREGFAYHPGRDAPSTYRCATITEATQFTLEAVCRG